MNGLQTEESGKKSFSFKPFLNLLCDKGSFYCSYFMWKEIYRKEIKGNELCN